MFLEIINTIFFFLYYGIVSFLIIKSNISSSSASGFKEKIFPYINVVLPLFLSLYQSTNLLFLLPFKLMIFCYLFYCLFYLRYNFAIEVSVKEFCREGPYKIIRHPLYFGELALILIHVIQINQITAYIFFLILTISTIIRANIEEKKFIEVKPEYLEYKRNTGMFFPKLKKKH
jgi:protein-S-isoprenylcysteine O-methyltransferase Ste14